MRLPEANAVNAIVSVLARRGPYSLDEVLEAVEVLTTASWVELRAGWDPASARIEVSKQLRAQRYGADPETGLYPDEVLEPVGDLSMIEDMGALTHQQVLALAERTGGIHVEIHDAKPSPEVRMRLLKGATTEQLLASRDELQAAITAAPQPADVPYLATALRQVQTELGQRYLLARRPRRVSLTWSPAERAQFVTAVRNPGDLVEDEEGAPLSDEQQPPDAQLPPPTLIVSRSSTRCSVCRKGALPDDHSHDRIADYGDANGHPGCGVIWSHITSDSAGRDAEVITRHMRPDLAWIDYEQLNRRAQPAVPDDESHLAMKREGLL